uniref:EF-hand domain-containing protein n=1 Tax=Aegilops tauschii subsp. strangulata TaxID=200361 RepID=A0A453J388_AEGTS
CRMYDFDRNGTMSFQEFLALNKFLQKVQGVFSTLERGVVDFSALRMCMRR